MARETVRTRQRWAVAGVAALALVLAACGDDGNDNQAGGDGGSPQVSADPSLQAMVPDGISSDGKILVGTDPTYAPAEFLDVDGQTVIGFDVDIFNAVASKLGLTVEWVPSTFDDIIPGVQSGKYEAGVSAFTINADRLAAVNMISYFSAGTQWASAADKTVDPNDACGLNVAVQRDTVQVPDIEARSQGCVDDGKEKITIEQFQGQDEATASVVSGKNDAMLADSPVAAYAVEQSNGQLQLAGDIYDSAPYGYVVAKEQTEFANAIQGAVTALIADGTYQQVLAKWGVEAGAVTESAVNPTP